MPTRRALVAATVPAIVVVGIFWGWLNFPLFLAAGVGMLWGLASLVVTRSVYEDAEREMDAWRQAAPDLAELDRR
jgi:fatty acid desaturase